jgi:hypothetical protein
VEDYAEAARHGGLKGGFAMKDMPALIVVLCLGIGCSETVVSPTVKVSVINDRPGASDVTMVAITLKNETRSSVYFTHNKNLIGFWRIERKIDNVWVEADRASIGYSSLYPKERKMLPPGETLRDSLTISQAGTYRMGFPFAWDEKGTEVDSLPTEEVVVE